MPDVKISDDALSPKDWEQGKVLYVETIPSEHANAAKTISGSSEEIFYSVVSKNIN